MKTPIIFCIMMTIVCSLFTTAAAQTDYLLLKNGHSYPYVIKSVHPNHVTFVNGESVIYRLIQEIGCSNTQLVLQICDLYPDAGLEEENGLAILDFSNVYVPPIRTLYIDVFESITVTLQRSMNDFYHESLLSTIRPRKWDIVFIAGIHNLRIFEKQSNIDLLGINLGVGYLYKESLQFSITHCAKSFIDLGDGGDFPDQVTIAGLSFFPIKKRTFIVELGYNYILSHPETHHKKQHGLFVGMGIIFSMTDKI